MDIPSPSIASQLIETGRQVYEKGLSPARSGNISARQPQDHPPGKDQMIITPSGWCLGRLEADQLVTMSMNGDRLSGAPHLKPSSEIVIHQEIYRLNPDCVAILHAHPPKATALCVAGIPLNEPLLAEAILTLGTIPLIPYILPGSQRLAESVAQALQSAPVVMMANHGVIATGPTLQDAFYNLELLESVADITITAKLLGSMNVLSDRQVKEVMDAYGDPTQAVQSKEAPSKVLATNT